MPSLAAEGKMAFYLLSPDSHWRSNVKYILLGGQFPANRKHLYNICAMLDKRRRRWVDVEQIYHKCFVLAGLYLNKVIDGVITQYGF